MKPANAVEFAHHLSRRRVIGTAAATIAFLLVQLVGRPVFRTDAYAGSGLRAYLWPLNAALLLLLLLPIGGYIWGRRVRDLVNDEVSRGNSRTATAGAFWLAMITSLLLYVVPWGSALSGREALYLVVTSSTAFALLFFAWLESRALRDG
jgi:hypothetical protein